MKIPKEVQCRTCGQVFCCAKCRLKHEDNAHQEMQAIRQICYICNNRPFPLRTDTKITPNNVLLQHILTEHLPLRCNRCSKVFLTASDFKTIVRCTPFGENNDNAASRACSLEYNPNFPTIMETPVESLVEAENKENIDENGSLAEQSSANRSDKLPPVSPIKAKVPTNVLTTPKISKELLAITDPNGQIEEPIEALLTPLSKINLRWKRKSVSFDSINGSTNLSTVNTSEVPNSARKKLSRTTSTPMMQGYGSNAKSSNDSYSSSLGQMSSIRCYSSGDSAYAKNDDHKTPATPSAYELEKVRAIIKSRSKLAVTPLRQVMSKSIQRAIAQHGHYSKMLPPGTPRKMSFNSTGSSARNSTVGSPSRKALDLRTTPVLKRSSSETCVSGRKNRTFLQKAHSDSSSLYKPDGASMPESQYFEAHENEASLEANSSVDQENSNNHKIDEHSMMASELANLKSFPSYYLDTPKMAGGILKKVISFTTPEMTRNGGHQPDPDDTAEVWATPCSIPPRSYSCSALQETGLNLFESESSCDEVFLTPTRSKTYHKLKMNPPNALPSTGKLWTIVSNVIRLASRSDIHADLGNDNPEYPSESDSAGGESAFPKNLVQKATSFAGFLRNQLPGRKQISIESDSSSPNRPGGGTGAGSKRRRINSVYTRPYESVVMRPISSPVAKRKRIQGRQPIDRMRNGSHGSSGSDF